MNACSKEDVARLRALARQVREIADLPQQEINRSLWMDVNDLHMTRPVLHVRDLPFDLIQYGDELVARIADPFWREIEQELLMKIYEWKHLRCDRVIETYINCPCVIHDNKWGDIMAYEGVKGGGVDNTSNAYTKAKHFDAVIMNEDDIEKIKTPTVTYDEAATMTRLAAMREVFDGILDVKLFGKQYFRVAPWDDIFGWIGMGEAMLFFYENPEFMEACVRRYIDCSIEWVRKYEQLGLLSSNNAFENVLNNDPGFTRQLPPPPASGIGAKASEIWGACSDQILTSVSPDMTEEFAFIPEKKYAALFGLFGYGCCERLDHKMKMLTGAFPNLRKVSVSPYSALESSLEQLGGKYTACFKPNSNYLVLDNWREAQDLLTKEMEQVLTLCQKYNNNLVINMKTIIELHDEPQRLWWWCDMARGMVDKFYA